MDVDQALFAAIDERPQQDAADECENRRIRADTQRQRQNHRDGKSLGCGQGSQCISHSSALLHRCRSKSPDFDIAAREIPGFCSFDTIRHPASARSRIPPK